MNSEMVRFNQLTGYLEPFPRQIHELARKTKKVMHMSESVHLLPSSSAPPKL